MQMLLLGISIILVYAYWLLVFGICLGITLLALWLLYKILNKL